VKTTITDFVFLTYPVSGYVWIFLFFFSTADAPVTAAEVPFAHTVLIENATPVPVAIVSAHSSCPCLTFTLSERVLLPGESARLEYTMTLAGMEGRVERFIAISLERDPPATPPPNGRLNVTVPFMASSPSPAVSKAVSPVAEVSSAPSKAAIQFYGVRWQSEERAPTPLSSLPPLSELPSATAISAAVASSAVSVAPSSSAPPAAAKAVSAGATLRFAPSATALHKTAHSTSAPSAPALTRIQIAADTRSIVLTVIGEANPSAYLKPIGVNYGAVTQDKIATTPRTVALRGANKAAKITAVSANPPFLLTAAADQKSLSVVLPKTTPPGLYVQTARVQTTDAAVPEMPIYLYAHILGEVEILPNVIEISAVPVPAATTARASAIVILRPASKIAKTFQVTSATLVPASLGEVKTRRLPDGSYRVHLSNVAPAEILPRSFLLLKTNSPFSPTIKIPIQTNQQP
jgi:hypothetical protein